MTRHAGGKKLGIKLMRRDKTEERGTKKKRKRNRGGNEKKKMGLKIRGDIVVMDQRVLKIREWREERLATF